jgi:hypothetical protein
MKYRGFFYELIYVNPIDLYQKRGNIIVKNTLFLNITSLNDYFIIVKVLPKTVL